MDYFEKNLLESLYLQPLISFRYVDNSFYLHTLEEYIEKFLWGLNEFDEKLKVVLSSSKKIYFVCFNESPLKMMKNTFYFILKAILVLKIIKFLSLFFFSVWKNGLIRNTGLISKFMTSQLGQETILIHILPNTLPSKDTQTKKFGQLIGYNKRNIVLQKSCRKRDRETSSRLLFVF